MMFYLQKKTLKMLLQFSTGQQQALTIPQDKSYCFIATGSNYTLSISSKQRLINGRCITKAFGQFSGMRNVHPWSEQMKGIFLGRLGHHGEFNVQEKKRAKVSRSKKMQSRWLLLTATLFYNICFCLVFVFCL